MAAPLTHSRRQRSPFRRAWSGCLGAALLSFATTPISAQAPNGSGPLRPGDIVVVTHDFGLPRPDVGTLVRVDPSSGAESTLSDFADPTQGPVATPRFGQPPTFFARLVIQDASSLFVSHTGFEGSFHVDPATGARTIVSDARVWAIEPSGTLLAPTESAILRVDPATGATTIVSDFQDPAQGPVTGIGRNGLAVERSGQIIVRGDDGTSERVTLFRVDPSSGVRTLLSDFEHPVVGRFPTIPRPLIDPSGDILVLDWIDLVASQFLRLIRVDAVTGAPVLTAFFPCATAPGGTLVSAALDEAGDVLAVVGGDAGFPHALYRIDVTTGTCRHVRLSTGEVAVVPTPLVNDMVSLSVSATSFEPPSGIADAPEGVFRIAATFTNESPIPLRRPFFRVAELSGGNKLMTSDRPADLVRLGAKGTRQTPHVGDDEVIAPGESIVVEFGIGLDTRAPFTFFVDVFGEPDWTGGW